MLGCGGSAGVAIWKSGEEGLTRLGDDIRARADARVG
jgi:hypothetical protein